MATFKCNQQRKQRAGGLTNRPGGAAPGPPPRHSTHQRRAASTALAKAEGTREEIIKYQGLQKGVKRLCRHSHTCWHRLKGFPNQWQLFRKLEEYRQKSK